ncbi:hypothetical protein D3C73_483980 [compost metagenome]
MRDGTMMRILVLLLVVAIIMIVVKTLIIQPSKKSKKSNVIQMKNYSSKVKKLEGQKCSFCGNRVKRLAYYADETSKVVGVCDSCKPQAERRELSRL